MPQSRHLAQIAGRPVLIAPTAAPALLDSLRHLEGVDDGGIFGAVSRGLSRLPFLGGVSSHAVQAGERRSPDENDDTEALAYCGPPCAPDAEWQEEGFFLEGSIAVIEIAGVLWDRCSWSYGAALWTYSGIARAIRAARADDRVVAIFLRIDSPGGLVDGLFALIEEIEQGSARHGGKPIWAFAAPSCFSAAYAIASACDRIVSMVEGEVGSIGAVVVHVSEKGWLEKHGIQITPIEYPEGKTSGAWWEELPDDARADLLARVTRVAKLFIRHVAATRPDLDEDQLVALRARCFSADNDNDGGLSALALGLIDDIRHEAAALAALAESVTGKSPVAATPSAQTPASPAAAATAATTPKGVSSTMDSKRIAALEAAAAKGDADAKAKLAAIQGILASDDTEDEDTTTQEENEDTESEEEDEDTTSQEDDDTEAEDEDDEDGQVDAKTARSILSCAEAKGRPKLAGKLATTPGMTVRRAKGLLKAAGKEGGSRLDGAVPDPRVRSNSGGKGSGSSASGSDCDQALAAFGKAYGGSRVRKSDRAA